MAKKSDLQIIKDFVRYSDSDSGEHVSLTSSATAVGRALARLSYQIIHGVKGTLTGHDKHLEKIGAGPPRKPHGEIDDSAELARMAELEAMAIEMGEKFTVHNAATTAANEFGIAGYDESGVAYYPEDHNAYIYRLERKYPKSK